MQKRHYIPLLLIIITFVVYYQVLSHDFLSYDDNIHVYKNPYVKHVSIPNVLQFWKKPNDFALVYTVWAIQAILAKSPTAEGGVIKLNPRVYHFTNLIFHILSVLIVFTILKLVIKNIWAAGGGALLFALHPVQVESVAWVTGLKDVLSGSLSLLAIWLYLLYTRSKKTKTNIAQQNNNPIKQKLNTRHLYYILATLSFVLAMMAKTTTVVVPVIVLLLDHLILKRPLKQAIKALIPWVILAMPMMILTKLAQPDKPLTFVPNLWQRILIMGDTITYYLYKLILPFSLGPDYGRSPEFVLKHGWVYLTSILSFGMLILLWMYRKKRLWLFASAGIFIVGFFTVLGIIPFHFQRISTVADRYLYLSMLGPALIAAWVLSRYKKKKIIVITFVLVLSLFGIISANQTKYWNNTRTFYKHALKINPDSWTSHNNLASAYESERRFDKAISHYSKAIKIKPDYAEAHYNLGITLEKQGRNTEAITHYSEALKINPNYAEAHYNMGIVLEKTGRLEQAITQYSNTIKIKPSHTKAYINLGTVLEKQKKYQKALNHYFKALQINPNLVKAHYNIGNVFVMQQKFNEAIQYYSAALRINPNYVEAHNNLGFVLEHQGRIDEAIKHYSTALRINPNYINARNNLTRAFQKQRK